MSGESLPDDRQQLVYERFTTNLKRQLRALITEDLIDEHRQQPFGQHSDALERVLNFLRRPPRYGLYARVPCREYQVICLPVPPGSEPQPVDATVYTDEKAAAHAVFLRHIDDLMRARGA